MRKKNCQVEKENKMKNLQREKNCQVKKEKKMKNL